MSWWGGKRSDVDRAYGHIQIEDEFGNDADEGEDEDGVQDRVCLSVADLIEENAQLRLLYAATAAGAPTKSASTSVPSLEVTPDSDSMDSDNDGGCGSDDAAYHTADSSSNGAHAGAKCHVPAKEMDHLAARGTGTGTGTGNGTGTSNSGKWRRRARDMSSALSLSEKRLSAERAKKQALAKRLHDLEEAIGVQSQAGKIVDRELRAAEQEVLKLKTQVLAGLPFQMQLREALQREQKSEAVCQSQASRLEAAARQRVAESARLQGLNEKLFAAQEASTAAHIGWEKCLKRIGELEAELAVSEQSAEHAMVCIALAEDALKKTEGKVRELEGSQRGTLQKLSIAEQEVARFRRQWVDIERQRQRAIPGEKGAALDKPNDQVVAVNSIVNLPVPVPVWNLSLACLPFASTACTDEEDGDGGEGEAGKR